MADPLSKGSDPDAKAEKPDDSPGTVEGGEAAGDSWHSDSENDESSGPGHKG